jgi:predicted nucleotidyltransferase
MNICGIVCEYNPFHNGHRYLIDECRRILGADAAVVCVMSGDFVQRGEAAIFLKHDRARAAVAGGADLVFELPLPWCMAPAETFARGAVGLLGAAGVVTHLCFGSECGDLSLLRETARTLADPALDGLLREKMADGTPYAAARQAAVELLTGRPAEALSRPNDILALEYLKALGQQGESMEPLAIRRRGAGHDSGAFGALPSASFLREKLRAGQCIRPWVPAAAADALEKGEGVVDENAVGTALLSRLRFLPEAAFAAAPDVSEGLEKRIFQAARTEPALEAVVSAAASKRYPRARIRRICVAAALGLRAGDSAGIPPYLRVLSANERGAALLREMDAAAALPVLTKPARVRELGDAAERVFTLGAGAADLCALGLPTAEGRRGDRDWRSAPAILK